MADGGGCGWRGVLAAVAVLMAASSAVAQTTPQERAREAAAMITAAGFRIQGNQILNGCGRSAQPRPAAVDMNGDGRPEAVVSDADPGCYGPGGQQFWVIQKQGPARWALVGAGVGRIKLLETRTNGWRDYSLEGPGCQRTWTFQPGQGYVSLKPCPSDLAADGRLSTGAGPPRAAKPAPGNPADREAAFRAAGFPAVRGKHLACDKSQEATIDIRDLNGDGRPDAVVSDFGTECYGSTEQGFVIVTKEANGTWRKFFGNQGVPTFLTTRGAGGWPDIENGGPGFCHPIQRWNGADYVNIRWKAEQPGACAGRR